MRLRSAAGVDRVFDIHARNAGTIRAEFDAARAGRRLLRRLPGLAEVAQVAVWPAGDRVTAVTASITDVTLRRTARPGPVLSRSRCR
ncbi:hypothetical protein ACWEOZ_40155 [Actinoplanes sp. NPDC004185]